MIRLKGAVMKNTSQLNETRICNHCKEDYTPERKTSKFCSDDCRRDNHRYQKKLEKRYQDVFNLLHELGQMIHDDNSYDVILKLKGIANTAHHYSQTDTNSRWRCSVCWNFVNKSIPDDDSCTCVKLGKKPLWKLQKTLT